ncbi:ester cyclase [Halobium salinum]|uniref:Ester cyclase n=1 Tax=Halobium salinum TaxID=1364940 RepID=A0ABD5PDQ4_9EURY|nr:ester cyclase [Halobium salinum]
MDTPENRTVRTRTGPRPRPSFPQCCRRTVEKVWNGKEYDASPRLYAKDCVFYGGPGGETTGIDASEAYAKEVHATFPDFEAREELCFCDDEADLVCMYLHYSGTTKGRSSAPSPREEGTTTGVVINRVRDGKVVEAWAEADALGFLADVGATPESTATK